MYLLLAWVYEEELRINFTTIKHRVKKGYCRTQNFSILSNKWRKAKITYLWAWWNEIKNEENLKRKLNFEDLKWFSNSIEFST